MQNSIFYRFLAITLIICNAVVCQSQSSTLRAKQIETFQRFKVKYSKKYKNPSQQLYRNLVVFQNADKVQSHNSKEKKTYTLALNQFSDLSQLQFQLKYATLIKASENIIKQVALFKQKQGKLSTLTNDDAIVSSRSAFSAAPATQFVKMDINQGYLDKSATAENNNYVESRNQQLKQIQKTIDNFQANVPNLKGIDLAITLDKIKYDTEVAAKKASLAALNFTSNKLLNNAGKSNNSSESSIVAVNIIDPSNIANLSASARSALEAIIPLLPNFQTFSKQSSTTINTTARENTTGAAINKPTFTFPASTNESPALANSNGKVTSNFTYTSPILFATPKSNIRVLSAAAPTNATTINLTKNTTNTTNSSNTTNTTNTTNIINIANVANVTSTNSTANSTIKNYTYLASKNLTQKTTDWSKLTGPARSQGLCGCCYVMATVNNLETVNNLFGLKFFLQLSIQQLIDCDVAFSYGCNGGSVEGVYMYISTYGIVSQYIYPYTSGETGVQDQCKKVPSGMKIKTFNMVDPYDCETIKQVLLKRPLTVGIPSYGLQFYGSGTFTDCGTIPDHAVLLVGFNPNKGWKIKNYWGSGWGESGYGWLPDDNECGVCEMASYITLHYETPYKPPPA